MAYWALMSLSHDMPEDASTLNGGSAADAPPKNGGKVRLLSLSDLDGRTRAAQFVRDTRERLVEDQGGAAQLSTIKAILIERYAIGEAMLNDMAVRWLRGEDTDLTAFSTLSNTVNRQATVIGIERRARDVTPTLRDYLQTKGNPA